MPRSSMFGERRPEAVAYVRKLSAEHQKISAPLTLSYIQSLLEAKYPHLKSFSKGAIRQAIYRIVTDNAIWFGRPGKEPKGVQRKRGKTEPGPTF